jgi:hypothetical protein
MAEDTDVEIVLDEEDLKGAEPTDELVVAEPEPAPEPEPEPRRRGRPPKVQAEPEPEPVQKVVEPEEGLNQLKANLAAAEARAAAAEAREREANQRTAQAQGTVQDSRVSQVEAMITAKNTALQSNKAALAEKWASGDFTGAADIQEEMAKSAADLRMLESGLEQLKNQPKPQPEVRQINDLAEALAVQLDPRSAQWVRQHPDYARDPSKYTQLMAAHNLAIARHEGGTDGYFGEVERLLGIEPNIGVEHVVEPVRRQAAPAAAPVTRGANGGASRPTVVRLTADEREMAHLNWPDLDEAAAEKAYAREKYEIERQKANGQLQ